MYYFCKRYYPNIVKTDPIQRFTWRCLLLFLVSIFLLLVNLPYCAGNGDSLTQASGVVSQPLDSNLLSQHHRIFRRPKFCFFQQNVEIIVPSNAIHFPVVSFKVNETISERRDCVIFVIYANLTPDGRKAIFL